jgi:uncharacterized protein (DUF433 family)
LALDFLRSRLSPTVEIVRTPDILHGKPRIEELPDDYTDLDRAQIEAAIEYYETHPELMDYIRMRKRAHERAVVEESRGPNPDS